MEPNQEHTQSHDGQSQAGHQTPEPAASASETTQADALKDQKAFAILGYILPILFFLPLLKEETKHAPFARFHANQQLILLAAWVIFQFVISHALGMFMYLMFLYDLVYIALLVLVVYGVYNAYNGQMKELPVIGGFKIL